jgi:hypothetical protein
MSGDGHGFFVFLPLPPKSIKAVSRRKDHEDNLSGSATPRCFSAAPIIAKILVGINHFCVVKAVILNLKPHGSNLPQARVKPLLLSS